MALTLEIAQKALNSYYQGVTVEEFHKVNEYVDLLVRWNRKISLTTVDKPEEILRFHFGESIFALKFCDLSHGRLADVGSGAGFPGLALKIFRPDLDLVLIEPNLKKAAFLGEVARCLKLNSVEIVSKRFEQLSVEPDSLQFVTSRALAQTPELISWSRAALRLGGALVLWVSAATATRLEQESTLTWEESKAIPNSVRRVVVIGHK